MYRIEYNPDPQYGGNSMTNWGQIPPGAPEKPEEVNADMIDLGAIGFIVFTRKNETVKVVPNHRVKSITKVD